MGKTEIKSSQIRDGDVARDDLNITDSGRAVVRKVVQGSNISINSTGADGGTGDVTITMNSIFDLVTIYSTYFKTNSNSAWAGFAGGTSLSINDGAYLITYGKDHSTEPGSFILTTAGSGSKGYIRYNGEDRIESNPDGLKISKRTHLNNQTITTITGSTVNLSESLLVCDFTANQALAQLTGGVDGMLLLIVNRSNNNLTIYRDDQIITAADNIKLPNTTLVLGSGDTAFFIYNSALARWLLVSTSNNQ